MNARSVSTATGVEINILEAGRGAPCLLLHGFGEGGHAWSRLFPALAEFCRPIAIDFRGHGRSSHTANGYELSDYVDDVVDVIQALGLKRFLVIGHSLGAAVGLRLADAVPGRVEALALLDYTPELRNDVHDRVRDDFLQEHRPYTDPSAYAAVLMNKRPLLLADTALEIAISALKRRDDGQFEPLADRRLGLPEHKSSPEHAARQAGEEWAMLKRLSCQTLLLRGAGSAILTPDAAKLMLACLSVGRLETIPFAGHNLMADNSKETVAKLAGFVRAVLARFC